MARPSREPRRILIVKLSSLGDVVQCLPTLTALRRAFPHAHIAWLVGPAASGIVAMHPALDEAYVLGDGSAHSRRLRPVPSWPEACKVLRAQRFDYSLDMQGLFRTALLAFLIGAPERVGFRSLQEGAFMLCNRRVVPDRKDIHAVEGYLGFARYMGADDSLVEFGLIETPEDADWANRCLQSHQAREPVAIAPGSRVAKKRWPVDRFAQVASMLAQAGLTPVIVGSAADAPLGEEIRRRAPSLDLTGKTSLPQLFALLRRCRAFIGNDSGPLHLAVAAGIPTVALFGWSNPARTGPYGTGHIILQGRGARWADAITPEQVTGAALSIARAGRAHNV